VQTAVEPGVFHLEAPVHDHLHAGVQSDPSRLGAPQIELGPKNLGPHGRCLDSDGGHVLQPSEYIHQIGDDREVGQRCVAGSAQDLIGSRVDEVHLEPGRGTNQVGSYEVRRPGRVGRHSDHGHF
ncbi:uncharacterized protein METZ01_LOCUS59447, partial [marine metagenome]